MVAGNVPRRAALQIAQHQHTVSVLRGEMKYGGKLLAKRADTFSVAERDRENVR